MNDRQKVQYLAEIIAQAEFVGFAVEILNAELELERPNIRRVFFSLQAILNHSANISKIIWGAPGRTYDKSFKDARTSWIQSVLGVNETSILHSREMRNNLEHLDDRIDHWSVDPATMGNSVDFYLGRVGGIVVQGAPPQVFFRQYSPQDKTMRFFDQEINIQDLVIEVGRVKELAIGVSDLLQPHRIRF
ncbi:hypothetical protein [Deinococcus caeni]|uniref:hypothetical protein n=1 Tax=Deinococcus caeni TaxID=569127 RepID=UPI0031E4F531